MARVLVPIADGNEEMEVVITVDTLRRAGWNVVLASVLEGPVTASRGVRIIPDTTMDMVEPSKFDVIVIPGGAPGVESLREDERVKEAIVEMHKAGKLIAAICAGPLVLQDAGILDGRTITSHPAVASEVIHAKRVEDIVVVDGNIITSQGPGTTFAFALKLIEIVDGKEKADEIARQMIL